MSILSTTGAITEIDPPPNVNNGELESNTEIFLFQEQENLRLSSPVSVDISSPGSYPSRSLTPGTISAGTPVDSYFLHFDRNGRGSKIKKASGSVTFDEEILGVIVKKNNHDRAISILGIDGTEYAIDERLFLGDHKDSMTWSDKTLTVSLETTYALDQVRVITEHSVPPTLASFRLNGSNSNLTIFEGNSVSALLEATDPNRDAISFFLDGSSIGTDTRVSGTRSRSKDLGVFPDNGTFTYTAHATDEDGKSSSTITRTVTVNNVAPTITSLTEDLSIGTNNSFSFAATATDPGLTDILTYEWDLDGDGNFDDFTGSSGEWSFSEPGDHEVKLRVSDGDGGVDEDSFTVTAEELKLPEPYSFRFTDIKAVSDDPEGDKFQFSFEIINWTDTPAAGIKIALNDATNIVKIGEKYPEFAGATVDENGRPLGPNRDPLTGNLNIPNNGTVKAWDKTTIEWNMGDPILNRDLLGAISTSEAIALVPGSELISGEPHISDIEAVDNGDNVRDGFVFTVDHINESEIISFDMSLLDENGNPINSGSDSYNYGSGVVTIYRRPHKEATNPDALFTNTTANHLEGTGIPKELEELFYNNVNRVTEFA